MNVNLGAADRARRLSELEYKYSFAGRLERFCKGRIRILPIRLFYEAVGAGLVGAFGGVSLGLVTLACCLAGEAAESITVLWARRPGRIRQNPKLVGRIVSLGSACWAVGMAGGVAAFWSIGGVAFWFLSFVFLFAALVNAQLVGGLHVPSLRLKQIILSGAAVTLTGEAYFVSGTGQDVEAFAVGAFLMLLTLSGLFVRLAMQNDRRHMAERRLIEAQIELEQSNESLETSKDRLRTHARNAESLAFDSQSANRAKSQFLATMSREIRAPMQAIIKTTVDLESGNLSPGEVAQVSDIRDSAHSLLSVVGDILDLSKADVGKLEIENAPFDISDFWEQVILAAGPIIQKKGLLLEICGRVPQATTVIGDEARIRQVVATLVSNAVGETDTGKITMSVTTKTTDTELSLCLSIDDQGPGHSRAMQARLFDGLGETDGERTQSGAQGLSLALARRLARLMGGDLTLRSELGRGNRFTLVIPLTVHDPMPRDRRAPGSGPDLVGRHLLVIAETNEDCRAIETPMRKSGAEFSVALTKDPVLEMVYDLGPDLVLLDVSGSAGTGLSIAEMIRSAEQEGGTPKTPIVAITNTGFSEDRKRCLDAGADAVVVKPVTANRLLAATTPLLAKKRKNMSKG